MGGKPREVSRICTFGDGHEEYHCVGCCVENYNRECEERARRVRESDQPDDECTHGYTSDACTACTWERDQAELAALRKVAEAARAWQVAGRSFDGLAWPWPEEAELARAVDDLSSPSSCDPTPLLDAYDRGWNAAVDVAIGTLQKHAAYLASRPEAESVAGHIEGTLPLLRELRRTAKAKT